MREKTQLELARAGIASRELKMLAAQEGIKESQLLQLVAEGKAVIPSNKQITLEQPRAIGKGLLVKVNANLGTSPLFPQAKEERKKLKAVLSAGADTVMDLSTGGNIKNIRAQIRKNCPLPLGTVPIYEAAERSRLKGEGLINIKEDAFFQIIEEQAKDGVDFVTVHCGITQYSLSQLEKQGRVMGIVSRGGALIASWMKANHKENPFYADFGRVIDIAKKYDLTLSLGDALRPGAISDATDRAQIAELTTLAQLAQEAHQAGVQVMIEGPGHVPLNQIEVNIRLEKALCNDRPFYVLGPLPTDIAAGYDHIAGAVGGALAAFYGADFLCYLTPTEHLGLPQAEDVREGVVITKIAAHIADLARGSKIAWEKDLAMAKARKAFDWQRMFELTIDREKAKKIHRRRSSGIEEECSMCGDFCALKIFKEAFK